MKLIPSLLISFIISVSYFAFLFSFLFLPLSNIFFRSFLPFHSLLFPIHFIIILSLPPLLFFSSYVLLFSFHYFPLSYISSSSHHHRFTSFLFSLHLLVFHSVPSLPRLSTNPLRTKLPGCHPF